MNKINLHEVQAMVKESGNSYRYWTKRLGTLRITTINVNHMPWACERLSNISFEDFQKTNKIKVLGYQAYLYIQNANRKKKPHNHRKSKIYLGTDGILYRVALSWSRRVTATKHVTFDEKFCPITRDQAAKNPRWTKKVMILFGRNLKETI